ncbi:MAG: hypothetical protein ACE5GU_12805 [Candidatus Scalinduaceae bacterium]
MWNKKFLGIIAAVVAFVSLTMLVGNFAYAEKEPKGPELPETKALNLPTCPTCKSVPAYRPTKRRVTAPVAMICPDCKKEITEFGVYHCDKCEKEFLACIECRRFKKAEARSMCPKCKKVLARRIKGKIGAPVKWEMKCPECKKKPKEWLLQYCDKCDAVSWHVHFAKSNKRRLKSRLDVNIN